MILVAVASLGQPPSASLIGVAASGDVSASGRCSTASVEPVTLRVQTSASFWRALSVVGEASPRGYFSQAEIDEICAGLKSASPAILGGASLVWGVALHGIADVQIIFGVSGSTVLFLKSESRLDQGIDKATWNRFISLNSTWHPGAGIRLLEYACLLVSLLRDRGVDATCPEENRFSITLNGAAGEVEVHLERTGATVVLDGSGALRSADVWSAGME